MKLTSVEITEFKSIRKSNPFEIGDITCLVGKNEAGKTALLEALYRLNPIIPAHGHFDVTDDYPRKDVEDYQQEVERGEREPAIVVHAEFEVEAAYSEELRKDFGVDVLKGAKLSLSKGYDNRVRYSFEVDEAATVKALVKRAGLPPTIESQIGGCNTFKALQEWPPAGGEQPKEQSKELDALKARVKEIADAGFKQHVYSKYIQPHVPKFLYFDEYYQLTGQVNIEALKQRKEKDVLLDSDRPMLGLIDLARLSLDELLSPTRTEWLHNKLEGASNHLTKRILKYWSQNKFLEIRWDVRAALPEDPEGMQSETNLWGRIYNLKHKVSTRLGTRSRGFVWFFSFLAWFSQQHKREVPLILLLDEPALFLHAKAQGDLLRYIEEELKPHQIIYTTHSPFMVDPSRFDRVRIVEDKTMESEKDLPPDQEGTKVLTDVLELSEDSLFPLQAALGYEITQTLFVGPNSLVVEGVSDLLYLQTMSALLEERGQQGLSRHWTITPVGGVDKVPTFVALLGAQKDLNIAVLIDIKKQDRQKVANLYKKRLLEKKKVLTFGDFTGVAESDVEDMFDVDFYLSLVNKEYKQSLSRPIAETDLSKKSSRITERTDEYLDANPLKNDDIYSHYRPARYLTGNSSALKGNMSDKVFNRFEECFKKVNSFL
jgi:predicted ATPase